jgi:hypothetical protein
MTHKKQYQDLVDRLVARYRPDVKVSKQFGISVLTADGQAFCGLNHDDMVFRLDGTALTRALKLKGAKVFEAAGSDDWVQVPAVHVGHWRVLAEDALDRAREQA